jgi:hypothetical protein
MRNRLKGAVCLAALRASSAPPTQITFSSIFPGVPRYLWRLEWFPIEPKGSPRKLLAIAIGSDFTRTDYDRVLRLIVFANCKYDPAYLVMVECPGDSAWNSNDFRLDIPAADAIFLSRAFTARKHPAIPTNPEHDWAWVVREPARGKDAVELSHKLAPRRSDKPNFFITLSRRLTLGRRDFWLIEGVPIDDVVTLL